MEDEAGFTLMEVLIGLIILGICASLVSVTLSGGLQAYRGVKNASAEVLHMQDLQRSMITIGRQSFLVSNKTQNESQILIFETGEIMSVQLEDDTYRLLWSDGLETEAVFETSNKLRLRVEQSTLPAQRGRGGNLSSRRSILLEQAVGEGWTAVASAPLVITAQSSCKYDIVGQRCR